MNSVCLGLGSNVEAESNIRSGIDALHSEFGVVELSPVYRTPAQGFAGEDFINLAARIETNMGPLALKRWLHELEDRHGRRRNVPRFSNRTLDIDILLYGNLWLNSPELEIPRDEIQTAAHVLKPLADLVPDWVHPAEKRTIAAMWADFNNTNIQLTLIDL